MDQLRAEMAIHTMTSVQSRITALLRTLIFEVLLWTFTCFPELHPAGSGIASLLEQSSVQNTAQDLFNEN